MLRMSKLADYGALILATMAERPAQICTSAGLATETGIKPPTVSKLLKALTRAGLVASRRGAHGGYSLGRAPAAISAVDMIEAIEGPFAITECTLAPGLCELEPVCQLSSQWQGLSGAIRRALTGITLADLIGPPITPTFVPHRPLKIPVLHMEKAHGHA